jgi:hypothetical protein
MLLSLDGAMVEMGSVRVEKCVGDGWSEVELGVLEMGISPAEIPSQ